MNRYQANQQRVRTAFMQAAVELILDKGYDNVTVSDICRVADYGRSTYYVYFKDKEALFWEILAHNMAVTDKQILDAIQEHKSPMREWLAWYMIFDSVPYQREFYLKLNSDLSLRLREWQRGHLIITYQAQLEQGIYSLGVDVPASISARFITGAILSILDYWLVNPDAGDTYTMTAYFFKLVFRQDPPVPPT